MLTFYPSRIPDPGVKRHRIPDPDPQHCSKCSTGWGIDRFSRLLRDVIFLGLPVASSYMRPNAGEGGVSGSQPMGTAVQKSPNKLLRSNSIFNLCIFLKISTRHPLMTTYSILIDTAFSQIHLARQYLLKMFFQ
jgi:hypothetical protein